MKTTHYAIQLSPGRYYKEANDASYIAVDVSEKATTFNRTTIALDRIEKYCTAEDRNTATLVKIVTRTEVIEFPFYPSSAVLKATPAAGTFFRLGDMTHEQYKCLVLDLTDTRPMTKIAFDDLKSRRPDDVVVYSIDKTRHGTDILITNLACGIDGPAHTQGTQTPNDWFE